ncbi:MAG TPA: DUF192 domain-containing protein [Syntrophomonadaceae bacterium]|nr:DUF192 domain-containing protein [Syntrophomonadaceae bacterium]
MSQTKVVNQENGQILMDSGKWADTFLTRLKGLLRCKYLAPGDGLIIEPCNMVHSLGMSIPIDVLFVSRDHEILHIIDTMRPNRFSPCIKQARYVVELPAGQVHTTETRVGHRLSFLYNDR